MSRPTATNTAPNGADEIVEQARYPSPPPHLTHISRGVHVRCIPRNITSLRIFESDRLCH